MSDNTLILSEEIILANSNINKIFEKCQTWLERLGVEQILVRGKPNQITARHRPNHVDIFRKDTGKEINIELKTHEKDVAVKVEMWRTEFPGIGSGYGSLESRKRHLMKVNESYHIAWNEYLVDLWSFIGYNVNKNLLLRMFPKKDLNRLITEALVWFIVARARTSNHE